MTYTAFDVSYRIARELNIVKFSMATAGLTTEITDAVFLLGLYPDDYFNQGSVWILRDSLGTHLPPEGEFAIVSNFVKATGVLTITPALSVAVAMGDLYALTTNVYPVDVILTELNKVLSELPVPTTDILTITTHTAQTEYTLPADMLGDDIEVWIQGQNVAIDNYWKKIHDWYIQQTTIGAAKKLVFRNQPDYAFLLKLVYYKPHPEMYLETDKLWEGIDINRVVLETAYRLLLHTKAQPTNSNADTEKLIAEIAARLDRIRWQNPIRKDNVKLNSLGDVNESSWEG